MHYDHKKCYCTLHINLNQSAVALLLRISIYFIGFKNFCHKEICLFAKRMKFSWVWKYFFASTMLKDSKTLGKKALEGFGVPLGAKKDDLYE